MDIGNWRVLAAKNIGLTEVLGKMLLSTKTPLPCIDGPSLLVGSDYSGFHKSSLYEVYSVLIVDPRSCIGWLADQSHLRALFLSENRSMSYKGLNDVRRRRALRPFLSIADGLHGVCASLGVSKAASTIFQRDTEQPNPELLGCFAWKRSLFERALRIIHVVSFFIAGLSRPNQDVLWISDEDEIAANPGRLMLLTKLWANVVSNYAVHNLRHLRCCTTEGDDGSNKMEDFVAITDLVAGALSDLLTSAAGKVRQAVISPYPLNLKPKASLVGQWLSTQTGDLKKVTFAIDKVHDSDELTISEIGFHDLTPLLSIENA